MPLRNCSTSIVFKISQEHRDRVKTPSERNVNDINIKPCPAIVAVKSTDAHLIYEAAPPLLPRCLFLSPCITEEKYRRQKNAEQAHFQSYLSISGRPYQGLNGFCRELPKLLLPGQNGTVSKPYLKRNLFHNICQ